MALSTDPDRSRVIRRLFRLGMSVRAATEAVDNDRVTLALLDHLVGGPRSFTRAQAAARAGLDEEMVTAIDRIAGLPDHVGYSETGIHHLSLIARLLQTFTPEEVLDQIRADVPLLRSLARRTLSVGSDLLVDGDAEPEDEVEAAVRMAEVARPLLSLTTELIGQSYRRVLLELINSDLGAESLRGGEDTIELAVGFVDVVGYTSLSARIDPTGLHEVLSHFEADCQQMVEEHPDVSLVKFLGDAGMFVSLDPVALATAMAHMVRRHEQEAAEDEIPTSGGLAFGPVLPRAGDYYGTPVNEAARLTDLARRHSVLASAELGELLKPAFRLRRLLPVNLQGLGRQRPYALREPIPGDPPN